MSIHHQTLPRNTVLMEGYFNLGTSSQTELRHANGQLRKAILNFDKKSDQYFSLFGESAKFLDQLSNFECGLTDWMLWVLDQCQLTHTIIFAKKNGKKSPGYPDHFLTAVATTPQNQLCLWQAFNSTSCTTGLIQFV